MVLPVAGRMATWVMVWASVAAAATPEEDTQPSPLQPASPLDPDRFANYNLIDIADAGDSIPTLFHKLINGDLELPGTEASLDDLEIGVVSMDEQVLAAVTESAEQKAEDNAQNKSEPNSDKDIYPTPITKKSEYTKKSWVLLSYKKRDPEGLSKEQTNPSYRIHRRQKRFTLKNKLRSIVVPLSVFNFLGFLPVRVPGLPYHSDLPSPDYSYYNTMHEVYLPHYKRRKSYRF